METYIGRLLDGRYELLEIIGTGGMAVVYKALDHRLNRLVAVKILKDDLSRNQEFRRRFHAESQAVAMLSHPNIVSVYDVSRTDDLDYIVMELIEGVTLKHYLEKKGALNWRETLHFSMQIAKALDHAHSRGIVHRAIKPHNMMILKDGSIKVADFGIARVASAQNTLTREALGSVHYISPEQAKGARVDNRSDLYSLGIVMYEMLTGRTPYDGETPVAIALRHITGGAPMPGTLINGIPRGLEQITVHAMATNVEDRYASAAEMLRDMEEFRKNPAVTFIFTQEGTTTLGAAGAATAPAAQATPVRPVHTTMPRSEAERYAAARAAQRGTGNDRAAEQRRAERARREQEQAAAKRRTAIIVSVVSIVALLLILVLILSLRSCTGPSDPSKESTDSAITQDGYVKVPNFVGKWLEDIDPDDYPELVIDVEGATYEYSNEYPKGQIMDQTPGANEEVRAGRVRTVKLVVSLGVETAEMPDFTNKTATEAQLQLTDLNLGLKITLTDEASETVPASYVIRTDPAVGTPLEKGQSVVIYYSIGSNKMPDLVNQSRDNARAILEAMSIKVNWVFQEEESDTVEESFVIRTNPSKDAELTKGQMVTIYVSIGDGKVNVPPVIGFSKMEAIQLLTDANLRYEVKEYYDEEVDAGKVISQSVEPNTRVEENTVVVIDISLGPKPTESTAPPTESTKESTEADSTEPTESSEETP